MTHPASQKAVRPAGAAAPDDAGDLPRASPLSLGHKALLSLRSAILDGRLAPGDRLVEERLSAELGMSRVPIREAIKQLVAEGLATPAEGRGVQVAALGPDFAQELIEVRAVLEGLNARLAARHQDGGMAGRIRDLLSRGDAVAGSAAPMRLATLNTEFHAIMAEAGANRVLQELMRPLRDRTELVFRRNSVERAAEDWREHAMILHAVLDGEEELAALLASRHVHRAAVLKNDAPKGGGAGPAA